jgi:hypothetical protein
MVTWYSTDITMQYLIYYDKKDGSGCRAYSNPVNYVQGTFVKMGLDNNNACLVKYTVKNNNNKSNESKKFNSKKSIIQFTALIITFP